MQDVQLKVLFLRTLAVLGFLGGLVVIVSSIRGPSSFPQRQHLEKISGTVAWVQPFRYGLKFGFRDDVRIYTYAQKSGDLAVISAALRNPAEQPITILIATPVKSDPSSSLEVLEIRSSNLELRSLDQVRESWAEDYQFGYAAGFLVLLAAGYLEYRVRRLRASCE
jgi:hypothetical protein